MLCFGGKSVKVAAAIVIALIAVGALICAYLTGLSIGMRRSYTGKLHKLGLNRRTATLYVRAVRILNRLHKLSEFDGDQAADQLSPETAKEIAKWAFDYRIGVTE